MTKTPDMIKSAKISDCGKYRYWLSRKWGKGNKTVCFIGLNPSTADAELDDPTIRRCINFAKSWGFDSLVMLNLFAYRATQPSDMMTADDPIGSECDHHLLSLARASDLVVACWGNHGSYLGRDLYVSQLIPELHALKINKATGQPAHPLYLRSDSTPFLISQEQA